MTHKVHLKQFTLKECEEYAESLKLKLTRKQVMECYMVMGGVVFIAFPRAGYLREHSENAGRKEGWHVA